MLFFEVKIHKVLLRAVHKIPMLLKRPDEFVIKTCTLSLVAHKPGIEIQRSVHDFLKLHLLHPLIAVFTFADSENTCLVLCRNFLQERNHRA